MTNSFVAVDLMTAYLKHTTTVVAFIAGKHTRIQTCGNCQCLCSRTGFISAADAVIQLNLLNQRLQLFFVAEGAYGLKWGAIMAACTVIVVPLFVLFAFCEKYIVAGISSDSAVKE